MIKMLIAEDEFLCRENLKNIDWAAAGITVCGAAEDGKSALELSKSERPDIIISDIEMPKLSGLELARKVSDILPETKIIILTAYTKFEYVQESVCLGVFKYILKPFTDESLIEAVKEAAEEVRRERKKNLKFESISHKLESSKYFLRSYFFESAKNGAGIDGDLFSMFGSLNPNSKYTAMVISLKSDPTAEDFSENYKSFLNVIRIITKYRANVIPFFDISAMTFLFIDDEIKSDSTIGTDIFKISESVSDYLDFSAGRSFVIGIGKTVDMLKDAEYSYSGAVNALGYSFYLGLNTVISIGDVEPKQNSVDYFKFYDEGFLNHIKVGDCASATASVKRLFDSFRDNHETLSTVQRICNELFVRLSMCLLQCGQNPDHLFNKSDIWTIIKKFNTIDELEEYILKIVEVTVSHINFSRDNKNKDLADKIKDYIRENPSTSLAETAEHFYHSPNYISSIFSSETGETIKNYIISVRIDIAKKLLAETQKSIYEIATEVGYKNPQHFSIMFKKHVGMTPLVFRSSMYN